MAKIINMTLNYNGIQFCAQVDQETHDAISKDEDLLCQYSKQVYEAYFENDDRGLSGVPSADKSSSEHTALKWTDKLTRLLIRTRLDMEQKFISPTCKKTKYWQDVARIINSIAKINITADACNTKYRNLLATSKNNKRKQGSTGEGVICWEYFNLFDEVLGNKVSSGIPPDELLGNSLLNCEMAVNNEQQETEEGNVAVASTTGILNSNRKRKLQDKSKNSGLSLQMYLRKKLVMQEIKENQRKEQEDEKIAREEKRWQEKKDLKEKEINAILALAKAISEKK